MVLVLSQVGNPNVLTLILGLLELIWNMWMGAKLAFTQIMAWFVALSSLMADSIISLVMSLSSSAVANALLVGLTSCMVAPM